MPGTFTGRLLITAVLASAPLWFTDQRSFASALDEPHPVIQIQLRNCGFAKQKPHYKKEVHLSDLPLDEHTRLALSGHILAIYFSNWSTYKMEAFFVDVDSGKCVDRKSWPVSKRVGLNDSADTQARIMVTSSGFLVHAGASLALYSSSLELITTYALGGYGTPFSKRGEPRGWSVRVAQGGKVIHLQPFTSQPRDLTFWMDAGTLKEIGTQLHRSGVETVSENAIVTRLAQGLIIDERNSGPRDLCFAAACKGLPVVLNNNEVLVLGEAGFTVVSVGGEQLWQRTARQFWTKDFLIENHSRLLTGEHFAIEVNSRGRATFDGSKVARDPKHSIVVYDRACRNKVLNVSVTADYAPDSDISLDDGRLVVLSGGTISIYTLPNTRCEDSTSKTNAF
jgi:hypothetical protein